MKQSKKHSFLEACMNTLIGFAVALIAQRVLFPLYGIHNSYNTDLQLVGWFTVISIVRSYYVRRLWDYGLRNFINRLAAYICR